MTFWKRKMSGRVLIEIFDKCTKRHYNYTVIAQF